MRGAKMLQIGTHPWRSRENSTMIEENIESDALDVMVTQKVGHAYRVDRLSLARYFYITYKIDYQKRAYWILGMQRVHTV